MCVLTSQDKPAQHTTAMQQGAPDPPSVPYAAEELTQICQGTLGLVSFLVPSWAPSATADGWDSQSHS